MILQVQIPEGLQAHFSQLRILKGLRARRCETEGGREAERHDVRVTRFRKALAGLCTSCYLAGDCGQLENCAATKKTRNTHSKGISGTVGVIGGLGGRS